MRKILSPFQVLKAYVRVHVQPATPHHDINVSQSDKKEMTGLW